MNTGSPDERQMLHNIGRTAAALEKIAEALTANGPGTRLDSNVEYLLKQSDTLRDWARRLENVAETKEQYEAVGNIETAARYLHGAAGWLNKHQEQVTA